jgi:exoribonuclease R
VFIDFNNKSREEIISQINKVSENFRAVGKVVAINDSPNRDKELLVTIKSMDDNSETTLKQAVELKKSMKNTKMNQGNLGIYAIPVSKKLPWMALKSIPDDILEKIDESSRNKQHYYMAKIIAWKPHCLRPVCKITQSIGEAGNLEAESLRLLKTFDICTEQYETDG